MGNLSSNNSTQYRTISRLLSQIVEEDYVAFYLWVDRLRSDIADFVDSPSAEELLNFLNELTRESEQIYYKEKLVVFPLIQNKFRSENLQGNIEAIEKTLSASRIFQEKLRLYTQHLRSTLQNVKEYRSLILEVMKFIYKRWEALCIVKQKVVDHLRQDEKLSRC